MIKDLYDWTVGWAATTQAEVALFFIALAESSFFPLPPDILMMAMALGAPQKALLFALICSIGSVIGGVLGYYIGQRGGRPILNKFISQAKLSKVEELFKKYDGWAIVIAGFTPIPYKVFTLSSGAFNINLKTFVIASFLGRAGRFFLVATAFYIWGPTIKEWIDQYFNLVTAGLGVLLILGFISLKYFAPKDS